MSSTRIAHLLDQLDRSLALQAVQAEEQRVLYDAIGLELPEPPEMRDVATMLQSLAAMQAPLYIVEGRRPRDIVKMLANLPIRLVNSKQAIFNRRLISILQSMSQNLESIRSLARSHAALAHTVAAQEREIRSLREHLMLLQQKHPNQNG